MVTNAFLKLAALAVLAAAAVPGQAQEGASVTGWVLDAESGEPVSEVAVALRSSSLRTLTDAQGRFHFSDVRSGIYVLTIDHPAFGFHADALDVPESGVVQLSVRLGPSVFELEPIDVEVVGRRERERRALGSPLYQITREEIEAYRGNGGSLSEILRVRVPSITYDIGSALRPGCTEFRRPASFAPGCQPPLVIVDGVRISAASRFLAATPLEFVESLTVVPPVEAATLYGLGATSGAIRVETRRSQLGSASSAAGLGPVNPEAGLGDLPSNAGGWKTAYDWDLEPGRHPWLRSWVGATVGTLGGLAVALTASGDCSPLNERRSVECADGDARLASVATFTLPVVGGALGANVFGRTQQSRGRMILTVASAVMPMFMGYFFATSTHDDIEFRAQEAFGRVVVIGGVPIVAMLADGLFRTERAPGRAP